MFLNPLQYSLRAWWIKPFTTEALVHRKKVKTYISHPPFPPPRPEQAQFPSLLIIQGRDLKHWKEQTKIPAYLGMFLQHWGTLSISSMEREVHCILLSHPPPRQRMKLLSQLRSHGKLNEVQNNLLLFSKVAFKENKMLTQILIYWSNNSKPGLRFQFINTLVPLLLVIRVRC